MTDPDTTERRAPARDAKRSIRKAEVILRFVDDTHEMPYPGLCGIVADELRAVLTTIAPAEPGRVVISVETLRRLYEGRAAGTDVPFSVLDEVFATIAAAERAATGGDMTTKEGI